MYWKEIFDKTLAICEQDPAYGEYAARERMLAFVFTLIQQMNENKGTYAPALRKSHPVILRNDEALHELKASFTNFTDELLFNATNSGEVQARPVMAKYYKGILWTGFIFILNYWAKDKSENQEKTDVFVEKTVHFMFDILAPNAVDSGIDLVRFLLQLRKSG